MPIEVTTEKYGNAVVINFSRPEQANALTFDMAQQLFNTVKPITTDRAIRAVMLRGQGGNFMSGIDMEIYGGDLNASLERVNQMFQPYNSFVRELQVMDKPVLAAVEGLVGGPGLSFMLSCDLVIAARGTTFNSKFSAYAMTPHGGMSYGLARKVGAAKANEIIMLGDDFTAEQAERWNLVNKIVDDDKIKDESLALLQRLAEGPTRAHGATKKLVMKAFDQDLNTQLSLEHNNWGASSRGFDFREAVRAHFAKRPAKFTGT